MTITPSDLYLELESQFKNDSIQHNKTSFREFCCVCGRSLHGTVYYGAGTGFGHRFACQDCYKEATSPPIEIQEDDNLTILDDHRIRKESEFTDDMVAYVEGLWGKRTFAFNVAVRNLEQMRRGVDDKALREPSTYHEALHIVKHVRALANDIARHFGVIEIRPEDDLTQRPKQ